jgi:hypothetical protein
MNKSRQQKKWANWSHPWKPVEAMALAFFQYLILLALASCASNPAQAPDQPLVQSQYRLQEDRQAFEKLRENVPEATKLENDELAFMEKLFLNPLERPQKIRDAFYKALQKKRDRFNKDLLKKREAFVKKERLDREAFSQALAQERADFRRSQVSLEKRKDFFAEIDRKRKDFHANQKEIRDDFEAQVRDDRKNFEDYLREKTADFHTRYREFEQRQRDLLKEKKDGSN